MQFLLECNTLVDGVKRNSMRPLFFFTVLFTVAARPQGFNIPEAFLVLISVAPPRVFNRFVEFQGSCGVNYPRVKSRVGIKM